MLSVESFPMANAFTLPRTGISAGCEVLTLPAPDFADEKGVDAYLQMAAWSGFPEDDDELMERTDEEDDGTEGRVDLRLAEGDGVLLFIENRGILLAGGLLGCALCIGFPRCSPGMPVAATLLLRPSFPDANPASAIMSSYPTRSMSAEGAHPSALFAALPSVSVAR